MKNILISGVSRGLGLQVAQLLLADGHRVLGISRHTTAELDDLQTQHPDHLLLHHIDLSDLSQLEDLLQSGLLPKGQPIHGLVNNAAWAYTSLVSGVERQKLEQQFAVNTLAPILLARHAIRNMLLHRVRGSLVHVSSVCAHTGYRGLAMYAATKGALEAFSKNTAREWGAKGIRSNCIVAGFMETAMSSSLDKEQKARIFQRTSLKQATDPMAVAQSIQFLLLGPESITGQNLFVDAGTI
ncbi:MAG: SDR family oxidoreductase [Bacteroidota bacterium]